MTDVKFTSDMVKDNTYRNIAFTNCDFGDVRFNSTRLLGCSFVNCSFYDSDMDYMVEINKCKFIKCNLDCVGLLVSSVMRHCTIDGCSMLSFQTHNTAMTHCKFINCNIDNSRFIDTDMSNTTFTGCTMNECDGFGGCDIGGTGLMVINPIGSRKSPLVYNHHDKKFFTGCFQGTEEEFIVEMAVSDDIVKQSYMAAFEFLNKLINLYSDDKIDNN